MLLWLRIFPFSQLTVTWADCDSTHNMSPLLKLRVQNVIAFMSFLSHSLLPSSIFIEVKSCQCQSTETTTTTTIVLHFQLIDTNPILLAQQLTYNSFHGKKREHTWEQNVLLNCGMLPERMFGVQGTTEWCLCRAESSSANWSVSHLASNL